MNNTCMLRPAWSAAQALQGLLLMFPWVFAAGQVQAQLTLQKAEQLAVEDPSVLASQARAGALADQAVADAQLPDPKLSMGVYNVPLDDLSMKKEGASQFRTGIRQAFPRGDTLSYRKKRAEWLGRAESERARLMALEIRRDVRQAFLELYYQEQAVRIIDQTRELFKQLVEITRDHYASGRVSQQDVLQAQLELSRLADRTSKIEEQSDVERARLTRWIGDAAWQPIDRRFPPLPQLQPREQLREGLVRHPAITMAGAELQAHQQMVEVAREQYKPGFDVGVEYRKRFGNDADGSDRADMMAAMLTLDLPVFTAKRQDKRLSASQQEAQAAIQDRDLKLRELQRALDTDYARWQRLSDQQALYKGQLLRDAAANAEAALHAYQSGVNEFNTLMRARITELDIKLQDMRIRVDRARAQARLLFLQVPGEQP